MTKVHLVVDGEAVCGTRNPKRQAGTKAEFEQVRPSTDQCVRCWTKISMQPGRFG